MSDASAAQNTTLSAARAPAVATRESDQEISPLQRERDQLARECDALVRERDELRREHARSLAEVAALGEAKRELDEFLSIASHELKTPLTSIRGYLQIAQQRLHAMQSDDRDIDRSIDAGIDPGDERLTDERLTDERLTDERLARLRTVLERAEQQTGQMTRLINDLLDASRVQASRLELRLAPRDLAITVRDIVEEQRLAVPGRAIVLQSESWPVVISMDAARVGQALSNLLTNALKYSPADAPITVRLRVEGDGARVEVSDSGPGLAPEEQRRVWDRFYRSPDAVARYGVNGLGLGLYISRAIIERHSGAVGVESAPGAGATFFFTLPLAAAPRIAE